MPPPTPKKGLLNGKLFGVPTPVVLVIGGVGGYLLYRKYKASSAAATAAAATTSANTPSASAVVPTAAGNYGTSAGVVPQILSATQGSATSSTASSTAYSPPSGETELGSGYYVPGSETPIPDASGNLYEWISSFAQAQPQIAAGQTLYYQPTPGIFQPATANGALIPGLGPSTPLFNLAQQNQAA